MSMMTRRTGLVSCTAHGSCHGSIPTIVMTSSWSRGRTRSRSIRANAGLACGVCGGMGLWRDNGLVPDLTGALIDIRVELVGECRMMRTMRLTEGRCSSTSCARIGIIRIIAGSGGTYASRPLTCARGGSLEGVRLELGFAVLIGLLDAPAGPRLPSESTLGSSLFIIADE